MKIILLTGKVALKNYERFHQLIGTQAGTTGTTKIFCGHGVPLANTDSFWKRLIEI